jgi:hypothetical protein
MSVKSIGFRPIKSVANDYELPQIRLSTSNQILQISEDTDIENLSTNITNLTQEAVDLETQINTLNEDIATLNTNIQASNTNIETQKEQIQAIYATLQSLAATISIIQPKVSVVASIMTDSTNIEEVAFQPSVLGEYGVFESVGLGSGVLGYSTTGTGVSPFLVGANIRLTFANSVSPSANADYLKNGGKMFLQILQDSTPIYQSKQGMFNFATDNNDNVGFGSSDVVLLPRGTYSYTYQYYVCTNTETPESTGQPNIFAQTAWADGSYYTETDKNVTGFTDQYEAFLISL